MKSRSSGLTTPVATAASAHAREQGDESRSSRDGCAEVSVSQKITPWFSLSKDHAHFVSGMSAGALSSVSLHPLHLVQTRLQVQEGKSRYSGTLNAFSTIVRREGVRGLYQGTVPAMMGSSLAWGSYMWLYSWMKRQWPEYVARTRGESPVDAEEHADSSRSKPLSASAHMTCAMAAGACVAVLLNPVWVLKTRFELQTYKEDGNYRSLRDAVRTIVKEEGFWGFYRGLIPALAGVTHGAVMFVAYEEIKKLMTTNSDSTELSGKQGFMAGAMAKWCATLVTYPYQVVKARLQQRPDPQHGAKYSGVVDAIVQTARREGIYGFYKGVLICLVRVTPGSAITFSVYEFLKPRLCEDMT